MLPKLFTALQVGSAVLLILAILLQQRGEGLSGGLVGTSLEYSTKRGVEKWLFYGTIVLAVVFLGVSLARLALGA